MARCLIAALALLLCVSSVVPGLGAAEPLEYANLTRVLDEETFVAFGDEEFESSQDLLLSTLGNAPAEIEEDEWSYLRTDSVARAMKEDSADLHDRLTNLVDKLNQNFSPYEEPRLLELRRLARRHLLLIENREQTENLRQSFQREKESLKQALAEFEASGSQEQHRRLATGIRWMEDHEMAGDFVRASRQRLSFPNLEVSLPASLLRSATMTHLPTQNEPVDRTSDGIRTRGSGELKSHAYLRPIPAINHGDFRLQFKGEFLLTATNSRKRVQFNSRATTRITGVAAIALGGDGFLSFNDLQVCATSDLRNGRACVDRKIGGRVMGRVVDRVIKKKTPEIEQALSRELRERVHKELGTQVSEIVEKANVAVNEQFWSPARRLDLSPRMLSVATANEHVKFTVLEDAQCGLAAPRPFSATPDGHGFAAFHATLVTDLMNSVYVRHMNPAALNGDLVQRLNASLPVQMFQDVELTNEMRLNFELDFPRPFQVTFEHDVVHLTMRAERIVLDETPLSGRDLTLSYRVTAGSDNQVTFELQGAPRLSSPDHPSDEDPPELIEVIRDELLAGLLPEFTLDVNGLLSDDEPLPLKIAKIASSDQWLVLSLGARAEAGDRMASKK